MVGSLRRTSSVPVSGGEESSSRRRTVTGTGSGSDNDSKNKEALPDILSDWEIIVKSLRDENESEVEVLKAPKSKPAKAQKKFSTLTHIQNCHSSKRELADSDKENSQLKKKSVETKPTEVKSEEIKPAENNQATPSTSYLFSPASLKKSNKPHSDISPNDDSDINWRRPTRSTYKAFETIFDSPELEEIPLKSELTGSDQKEIDALKAIFTPQKEIVQPSTLVGIKGKRRQLKKSKFPLTTKNLNKGKLWEKTTSNIRKRGRPRKIQLSDNLKEKIKKSLKEKKNIRESKIRVSRTIKSESHTDTRSVSESRNIDTKNIKRSKDLKGKQKNIQKRRLIQEKKNITEKNIIKRRTLKERRSLKERRITRSFINQKELAEDISTDDIKRTACKQLIVKIENLKFPCSQEMDFLGFGTSPSPRKKVQTSPDFSDEPHKKIIVQESLDLSSDENVNDVESDLYKQYNNLKRKYSEIKEVAQNSKPQIKIVHRTRQRQEKIFTAEASLEFESYFGSEKASLMNDFEGFSSSFLNQKTCLKCLLVVDSPHILRHHMRVGHKKIYPCPFDIGDCVRSKGAVDFHKHLVTTHSALISFLQDHLASDIETQKVTHFTKNSLGCGTCLMPLDQPLRCIHEILVHGIWPPSILNLSPVAIDQHASLWWTGQNLAFACHLCHSPENSTFTIPIISSAPHCFPLLLSNHVRNVHLLNLPLIQGWYLIFKLLLSLPAFPRRTLATTIALGVDSKVCYACCTICGSSLRLYANMNLNQAGALCKRCDILCRGGKKCWHGCKNIGANESILDHMLHDHRDKTIHGWCITCDSWASDLVTHIQKCSYGKLMCKLCGSKKLTDMSVLNRVWHSLSTHSFFCPIPMCCSSNQQPKFFSYASHLYNHLLSQHLPEWNKLSIEQISCLIFSSKKYHGFVLSSPAAMQLSGTWIGVSGHQYCLQGNTITPRECVKVSLICLLCSREWMETVAYTCKEGGAVCSECTLVMSQYEGKHVIKQCPVFKCLEDISSMEELCQHLTEMHKLCPLPKKSSCSYCGPVSLASPLSSVIHNVLKHKIACLLCPFTAPTSAQIFAHRATMHGLPSWDAVYQHLKMEENSRSKKKPEMLNGIVKVWDGEHGTYSLWEQSLKFSDLLITEQEDESGGIINQSLQETCTTLGTPRETTMVDQWCSSICSVSMSSPSKSALDSIAADKDIKPDISKLTENLHEESANVGINASSDSSEDSNSALEIDTAVHSDGSTEVKAENSVAIVSNINSREKIESDSKDILPNKSQNQAVNHTEGPALELVEALNCAIEEGLNSVNHILAPNFSRPKSNCSEAKLHLNSHNKYKKSESKGLAENACFDMNSMAENILKDLEEKYCATCVDCGNSVQLSHLKVHMKTIHPGKIVHCCCGYTAELYDALVHSFHMSHIPSEARPIVFKTPEGCDQSMIVLEARSDLKTMNYPCYKCYKKFKQEKSRQLHYNLCKLEKKFDCDICGEKFALDNHLQKHKEWKHNPQVCKHCSKTFTSSSSLSQHVLHIHKKPLTFCCKQCGDAFNTSKQLKVHLRIHSGLQPHACTQCSSTFISHNLLRKHIIKSHKNVTNQKMNGVSSSTDSSDSDDSDSDTRRKCKRNVAAANKIIALTESDLNTTTSEADESPPKKLKTYSPTVKKLSKDAPASHKDLDSKSNKAGIYKDQGVVSLPEIRSNVKNKVEFTVGRVCAPCSQEFESSTAKLLHMYLIHPGLVLTLGFNECSFCHHKFASADDVSNHHLDKHQRTALSNGNFRCLCGLVFREDGAYYFHLYYAHKAQRALNIGGEIVCRVCDGRPRLNKIVDLVVHLSDRHTMFDHVRFNDSYMCNFCYKAFESWTVLSLHFFMVHKATKSQTLSYDCPFCQGASPWHSLEALQYHLDNVHRGRHTQSRPVPEHSRNIYTPAPAPSSPTKKDIKESTPIKPLQIKRSRKPQKQKTKGDQQQVLYCICQSPYDEVSDMIGCDNPVCKFQWFHFKCVGIMAAPEGNWYCPNCKGLDSEKMKQVEKQNEIQADLYEYYSNYSNDVVKERPSNRSHNHSSSSSSSSNSSSSSSSNSSSSSSSSSNDSSSGSEEEN